MEIWEHDIISDLEGSIARTVLYSIYECPMSLGRRKVCDILRGSVSPYVFSMNLHTLETYGILASFRRSQIYGLVDRLTEFGLVERTDGARPVLKVTEEGERYMSGGQVPHYLKDLLGVDGYKPSSESEEVLNKLLKIRSDLAEKEGVRPYRIFSNRTLLEIVRRRPSDHDELNEVYGLGQTRISTFGDDILKALKA